MEGIELIRLHGAALSPYLDQLGQLRISVFADYPYLYEGSLEYEKEYLKVYLREPESLTVGLVQDGKWIGATTAIPLKAETKAIQKPFLEAGIPIDDVFYFGESVLLPNYRGRGFGHLFFDERERFAQEKGYSLTAFCSVIRPDDHPLKPAGYRSNEAFWTKRGYTQRSDLRCHMSWLDKGETLETEKQLEFWIKEWK